VPADCLRGTLLLVGKHLGGSELCEARPCSFPCERESDMGVESGSGGDTVVLLSIAGDVFNTEGSVGK